MQTLQQKNTINCKGQLINIQTPIVMGILNITPDSFFDGGKHNNLMSAIVQAEKMLNEGASIIDIGAQSSRPGSDEISTEDELKRAIPVIEAIKKEIPNSIISIDTNKAIVAKEAVFAGASIVNDISSGDDDTEMLSTILELNVPYIMMHKLGNPKNMQQNPTYQNVVLDIINYFIPKVEFFKNNGFADIIIDPGFGFGKTLEHNYSLLNRLNDLNIFELPILVGLSRKLMLQKIAETSINNSLNATSAANTIALMKGAQILRVHDVKEAVECIKIYQMTKNSGKLSPY